MMDSGFNGVNILKIYIEIKRRNDVIEISIIIGVMSKFFFLKF